MGGETALREYASDPVRDALELADIQSEFPQYKITHITTNYAPFYVAEARETGINPCVVQTGTIAGLRKHLGDAVDAGTGQASMARVYDYWLGGHDWFEADQRAAERVRETFPAVVKMARENRAFLDRAVTHVATRYGIGQFIDVGSGLPTVRNTHEIARDARPGARVAYVDIDPVAVAHARALLATSGVTAVVADMRDPAAILAHPEIRDLTDLSEPVCVILASVLHFVDAAAARDITSAFAAALAPGSCVIISVGRGEDEAAARFRETYRQSGNEIYGFSLEQIAGLFDGLEIIPPGLAEARLWRPGWETREPPRTASILAGIGVVR